MKELIVRFFEWWTGEDRKALAYLFSVYLFLTRSRIKAYWHTLTNPRGFKLSLKSEP